MQNIDKSRICPSQRPRSWVGAEVQSVQLRRGLCRSGFMPPLCFPGPGLICASPGSHFNLEPTCFKLLWLPVAPKVILVAVDLGAWWSPRHPPSLSYAPYTGGQERWWCRSFYNSCYNPQVPLCKGKSSEPWICDQNSFVLSQHSPGFGSQCSITVLLLSLSIHKLLQ